MNQQKHQQLRTFLSETSPASPSGDLAREMERHLGECDECAIGVANSELHREALLHAIQLEPRASPPPGNAVRDAHREFVTWARRAAERLNPAMRAKLDEEVPANLRSELPQLASELPPELYRLALAVSEASLAVRSLVLRNERTVLSRDGNLFLHGRGTRRRVPATYVAARIAEHVDLSPDVAASVWSVLAELALDGRLGLPGLPALENLADGAILAVEKRW